MLNEALRLVRVFHDINQSLLAEKLQISKSYLSEIESGKKSPTLDILERYSEIFEIPVSSILLFSEKMDDNSFSEKSRVFVASKIIKIMNWVSETEDVAHGHHQK
jgi:transcriptional regulator with XRE-family HTH domain